MISETRLPSSLRPTTCKRMHLVMVTCSRVTNSSHIIRSTISENPILHAYVISISVITGQFYMIKTKCDNY